MIEQYSGKIRATVLIAAASFLSACTAADANEQGDPAPEYPIGYSDTPVIPGTQWRVHDIDRPRPEAVQATATSVPAPSDAIVLFDGQDLSQWQGEKTGGAPAWRVEDRILIVDRSDQTTRDREARESIVSKESFGDVQLHLEWRAPQEIIGNSQRRGNSGVIFMGRYEVQILDSFENPTYADGQAAALYGWKPPLVNATAPTDQWQSYDIVFEAPRWDDAGELVKKARVTVFHNGVMVHHAQDYLGAAAHKTVGTYTQHAEELPIKLQDHGDPIAFRNIWVRRLDLDANL